MGEYWSAWKNKRRELAEDASGLKERIGEEIGQRFFARPGARILTRRHDVRDTLCSLTFFIEILLDTEVPKGE